MDCPNCGVYNPEDRTVCWRCDRELPKPEQPNKRADRSEAMRRMWILIAIALIVWLVISLLPILFSGPGTP